MDHHALEEHDARVVFQRIARSKLINFRDLDRWLKRDGLVRNNLRGVLEQLVEQRLIDKQEAPVYDFNTYYLSVNGLTVNRTLDRLRPRMQEEQSDKSRAS